MTKGVATGRGGESRPFFPHQIGSYHTREPTQNLRLPDLVLATSSSPLPFQLLPWLAFFPHPTQTRGFFDGGHIPLLLVCLSTVFSAFLHLQLVHTSIMYSAHCRCTVHVCYIDNGITCQQNRKDKVSFTFRGGQSLPGDASIEHVQATQQPTPNIEDLSALPSTALQLDGF